MVKYGTFMADAILVALASRPLAELDGEAAVRRLALVRVPEPEPERQPAP